MSIFLLEINWLPETNKCGNNSEREEGRDEASKEQDSTYFVVFFLVVSEFCTCIQHLVKPISAARSYQQKQIDNYHPQLHCKNQHLSHCWVGNTTVKGLFVTIDECAYRKEVEQLKIGKGSHNLIVNKEKRDGDWFQEGGQLPPLSILHCSAAVQSPHEIPGSPVVDDLNSTANT